MGGPKEKLYLCMVAQVLILAEHRNYFKQINIMWVHIVIIN